MKAIPLLVSAIGLMGSEARLQAEERGALAGLSGATIRIDLSVAPRFSITRNAPDHGGQGRDGPPVLTSNVSAMRYTLVRPLEDTGNPDLSMVSSSGSQAGGLWLLAPD